MTFIRPIGSKMKFHQLKRMLKTFPERIYFVLFMPTNYKMLPETFSIWSHLRGCNKKFPDWVDNEIYAYLWYYSLLSPSKGHGGKSH